MLYVHKICIDALFSVDSVLALMLNCSFIIFMDCYAFFMKYLMWRPCLSDCGMYMYVYGYLCLV